MEAPDPPAVGAGDVPAIPGLRDLPNDLTESGEAALVAATDAPPVAFRFPAAGAAARTAPPE